MKYVIDANVSKDNWKQTAKEFEDNSIYQTWEYQQVRAEEDEHEFKRFVIRDSSDNIVCMGIVRIKTVWPIGFEIPGTAIYME